MDMARRRIDLRLDEDFLALVDAEAERLGQTRTKFVERALESALGVEGVRGGETTSGLPRGGGQAPSAKSSREAPSASSRASEHKQVYRQALNLPGVKTARELALERQRRLNEGKG